jgi:hypothetical protein
MLQKNLRICGVAGESARPNGMPLAPPNRKELFAKCIARRMLTFRSKTL